MEWQNAWNLQLGIFFIFLVSLWIAILRVCLRPLNRIRLLTDQVGFSHVQGSARKKAAQIQRLRQMRQKGRLPPSFPNGWYALAESRELDQTSILHVAALGENFAVFRGQESGQAYVTNAYCPHLGADITAGGKVIGDCVQCPFHHWQFAGQDGQCVAGPESAKTRGMAQLGHWDSKEVNGLILVWYHSENLRPQWSPLQLSAVNEGDWLYQGRNEYHVACHIQDISENGADPAHFDAVHSTSILCGGEPSSGLEKWLQGVVGHVWGIEWRALTDHPDTRHRAQVKLRHQMKLAGRWNLFSVEVMADQIGPSLVHLHFQSALMGHAVMIQYVLPLEPMVQKVVHLFYCQPSWWTLYAKMVLWGESILFERDVTVWNSKRYVPTPLAGSEDSLLIKHRRWYSQFYSNSKAKGQATLLW